MNRRIESNRIIGDSPPDLKRRVDQSQKSEVKVSRYVFLEYVELRALLVCLRHIHYEIEKPSIAAS